MTRLLLAHGADPNLPEEGAPRGLSLWIAVNDRQREIVELLFAHGADPNAPAESSGTPMSQAKRYPELAELLRTHGGRERVSDRDRVGRPLERGKLDEAKRLLRDDPQWLDGDWGDGILAGPARDGRHDVIAMLLRLGARVPPVSKWAPYYYFKHQATAAFLLEHAMVELLLERGANPSAAGASWATPLAWAKKKGHDHIAEMLRAAGGTED